MRPQRSAGLWSAGSTHLPLAMPFQQRSSLALLMANLSLHSMLGRLIQKSWASRSCVLASETCRAAVRPQGALLGLPSPPPSTQALAG